MVNAEFHKKLFAEDAVTLSLDGWSNCRMQSLYGFVAIFSGGVTHLLGLQDLSLDRHTAQFLAGSYSIYLSCNHIAFIKQLIWFYTLV